MNDAAEPDNVSEARTAEPETATPSAPTGAPIAPVARTARPLRVGLAAAFVTALVGGNVYQGVVTSQQGDLAAQLDAKLTGALTDLQDALRSRGEVAAERERLATELESAGGRVGELDRRVRDLEGDLDEKDRHAATLAQQREDMATRLRETAERLDGLEERRRALEQRQAALEREKAEVEKERVALFDELGEAKEALDAARRKVADLDALIAAIQRNGHNVEKLAGRAGPARLEGRVLVVNDRATPKTVIISLGADSGVDRGDVFHVFHGGAPIARVEVRHVEPTRAGALIVYLEDGAQVRPRDEVRTYLE